MSTHSEYSDQYVEGLETENKEMKMKLQAIVQARDDELTMARNTIKDLTKEIDEHPYCTGGCQQCKHRGHCYGEDAVKLLREVIDKQTKQIEGLEIKASAREAYYKKIDRDRVVVILDKTETIKKLQAKIDEGSVVEFIDHDKCEDP